MSLPEKPADVAQVSDAHWKAALDEACRRQAYIFELFRNWSSTAAKGIIDHARCLILLGEVKEPVDPIDAAIDAAWDDFANGPLSFGPLSFEAACRKHFAGLTFPAWEQSNG